LANNVIYGFHPKPVPTIYQRSTALGLFDEVAEVMRLMRKVKALDTALRHDAAAIGLAWLAS
jgi:hypothetical protein